MQETTVAALRDSLLVRRNLNAVINLVFADDGAGWLRPMLQLKSRVPSDRSLCAQ